MIKSLMFFCLAALTLVLGQAQTVTTTAAATTTSHVTTKHASEPISPGGRLGRVTAYWAGEGDYDTGRLLSATGVRLHGGHCAVDPSIIPYGSMVEVAGVGKFLAVDTHWVIHVD
jgi:cystine transport system substrate-binding protein